jgi:hypothetical protein
MPAGANLVIAVPVMAGIHPILASRLIRWGRLLPAESVHFYFACKVAPVDRARNTIVEMLLKTKTPDGRHFTHLLMIDTQARQVNGKWQAMKAGRWIDIPGAHLLVPAHCE